MVILKEILTFRKKTKCTTCGGKGKIVKCGSCNGKGYSYLCAGGTMLFCGVVGIVALISGTNLLTSNKGLVSLLINSIVFAASLLIGILILKEHKEQTKENIQK